VGIRVALRITFLTLAGWAASGAAAPAPEPPVEATRSPQVVIHRAIEQLGSHSFTIRRAASDRLLEIGPAALGPLCAAAGSGDLEVSARSIQLILRIAKAGDATTGRIALESLERLAQSTREPVAGRAAHALGICRRIAAFELARRVLSLGGSVVVRPDQGAPFAVQHAEALPALNFSVTTIDLRGSQQVTSDALRGFGVPLRVDQCLLGRTKIGDVALSHLARWPKLNQLYLEETAVTDTGLRHITRLEDLQTLGLSGTRVSDAGLIPVGTLVRLKALDLEHTSVTDAGIAHLTRLDLLTELNLRGTLITDRALPHLVKLPALQSLTLAETKVSDKGLAAIAGLKTLDFIDLRKTAVTQAGAARLRQALPELSVRR
jgi:hypothetical protein